MKSGMSRFMTPETTGSDSILRRRCGKLVSGRYNAYNFYKLIRQICWAHLKRDFKAIGEAKGAIGKIGEDLYGLAKKILKLRKRVRDGTVNISDFTIMASGWLE